VRRVPVGKLPNSICEINRGLVVFLVDLLLRLSKLCQVPLRVFEVFFQLLHGLSNPVEVPQHIRERHGRCTHLLQVSDSNLEPVKFCRVTHYPTSFQVFPMVDLAVKRTPGKAGWV
jgi:hypothetical protein